MPITKENLLQHELIGLQAKIIESSEETLENREGIIVNETRNTLTLKEKNKLKTIPKSQVKLSIILPNKEKVNINGKKLIARPADRVKKYR